MILNSFSHADFAPSPELVNAVMLITGIGMAGGSAGAVGINRVVRRDGTQQDVPHIAQVDMQAGDVFEIHTPGGGGYGSKVN
jgi:N-methylhydantoinase B/oxoprolinase/acetone carboxylase alpha subunit